MNKDPYRVICMMAKGEQGQKKLNLCDVINEHPFNAITTNLPQDCFKTENLHSLFQKVSHFKANFNTLALSWFKEEHRVFF